MTDPGQSPDRRPASPAPIPLLRIARLRTRRRLARLAAALRTRPARLLLPVLAALLAVPLLTAAHQTRPAPYGDRLVAPEGPRPAPDPAVRIRGAQIQAYDTHSGRTRWTYTRTGHTPLTVHAVPGHLFALWSDGLVTDTVRGDGHAVRWHRAIPAFDGRPAGVLQPLDPAAEMLAVLTPHHIAAYRTVDGDLRWVLPAKPGCRFVPARTARRGHVLLVAQPCGGAAAWTEQIVPVDALGRMAPGRNPLGNGRTAHDQDRGTPDPGGRRESAPGPRD
ncbi:hypothetical protein GCM10010329_09530 [Streptomyces spiroverticillatus]|uniref:Uncharacterized protein n=1 Tax=Streptomyces finlayi TaxID=67296 RepID=A0A919CAM6_9ACTN|nr:hypothetical protein [Streptomyces finlayi]GGZ91310.1 hypothetical protein GCM10010329_09530 [Streptomyces spiroverticillatus]GHC93909.1 hypothetical protein GCM10010334_31550 [Streptomyces finlayi]